MQEQNMPALVQTAHNSLICLQNFLAACIYFLAMPEKL
jgi:hypothetical protein